MGGGVFILPAKEKEVKDVKELIIEEG